MKVSNDVKEVIDEVSSYLSEWGFVPYWDKEPKFEVRSNWYDGGEDHGYDTCLFLRWVTEVVG